jgi:hypothetical protein
VQISAIGCCGDASIGLPSSNALPLAGTMGPEVRQLYRAIEIYSAKAGLTVPRLVSQCRSREYQLMIQKRWDSGLKEGLVTRPADPDNSAHVPDANGICWAFDLGNDLAWLNRIGSWVSRTFPGATWGGNWLTRDPNHFQVDQHEQWGLATRVKLS